jgi:uncharacterized protein YycO
MGNQIPLDPGIGGRSIGAGALVNADIIVSTTRAGVSGIIRIGTASEVSHATLYEEGGWVIEAIKQGVVLRTLTEALADDVPAVAYRNPSVTHSTGQLILNYASKYIGQPYSIRGAVSSAYIPCRLNCRGHGFFCSQLVIQAYRDAGVPLTDLPAWCITPKSILDIKSLRYVGHLKGEVTRYPILSP